MSILFILIPLILGGIFILFKKFKTGIILNLFSVFLVFVIGAGVVPSFLLKNLQNDFTVTSQISWKNNNVIVLLGGGVVKNSITDTVTPGILAYSRIYETAKLYFLCVTQTAQCKIIVSGGDPQNKGVTEAEVYQNALLNLNVNADDIAVESESKNTYQNADYVSTILKENEFDQIILVTSAIHLKRALLYFSNFGVTSIPAPSDYLYPFIEFIPIAYNFVLTDFAVHEYFGIIRFHVYNMFGLNKIDIKK